MKKIKNNLRIFHIFFCSIGFNFKKMLNIFFIFKYFKNLIEFKFKGGRINKFFPILGEHTENSGNFDKQYFLQDIIVAQYIYKNNPSKHVDFGSRIDGFVANVASFRKIEVFDIRDNHINIENIKFHRLDLTKINNSFHDYADSLSCLHTLEHIGLGRYGDNIDPDGYKLAFKNLLKILKNNGTLYLSFPISNLRKVYFNSERVFNPFEILNLGHNIKLERFDIINDNGEVNLNFDINNLKNKNFIYSCGIYTFRKI